MRGTTAWRATSAGVLAGLTMLVAGSRLHAQVRGVYPLGMSAMGSGGLPASGITYSNAFLFYGRDQLTDAQGDVVATGRNSVLMDMNTLMWVGARGGRAGGVRYAFAATIPIANNSLTRDSEGSVSGGGGLADSFYQPLILGWTLPGLDLKVAYGFLAPTGRFTAGAPDNVGSGYWTHTLATGQTVYLTGDRATTLSAFEMYEFHGTQEGTDIHPGQNADLDFSLTRLVPIGTDLRLQGGVVGYAQWQTSDRTGPSITPEQRSDRYRVYALGAGANVIVPSRKVVLGFRYFDELGSRSSLEGNSVQISAAITF